MVKWTAWAKQKDGVRDRLHRFDILEGEERVKVVIAQNVRQESQANLIAAAPDLLEALKVAQMWLDVDGRFDMRGINAAIAKAEGRT